MNHHNWYCGCRRCLRKPKSVRRRIGREVKKARKREELRRQHLDRLFHNLEAAGLQVISIHDIESRR